MTEVQYEGEQNLTSTLGTNFSGWIRQPQSRLIFRGQQTTKRNPGMPRSKGHHQVPQWLLRHFYHNDGKTLWVGARDTRDVRPVAVRKAFLRNDVNSRIDYQSRGEGMFLRKKSDPDEEILAVFDGKAAPGGPQAHQVCRGMAKDRNALVQPQPQQFPGFPQLHCIYGTITNPSAKNQKR